MGISEPNSFTASIDPIQNERYVQGRGVKISTTHQLLVLVARNVLHSRWTRYSMHTEHLKCSCRGCMKDRGRVEWECMCSPCREWQDMQDALHL